MKERSQRLSDCVKATAVANAGLAATFAASGRPVMAAITGVASVAGITVDYVTGKLHQKREREK